MLKLLPSAGLALVMLMPEPATFALAVGVSCILSVWAFTGARRWLREMKLRDLSGQPSAVS